MWLQRLKIVSTEEWVGRQVGVADEAQAALEKANETKRIDY